MKWLGILGIMASLVIGCDGGGGPQIMPLDDVRGRVGDTVIIDLRVLEAVGDERWSFSAPSIPDIQRHAKIYQSGGAATFRWVPMSSQAGNHQFTFTVENSRGSDSETITIEIIQTGGTPQFIHPRTGGTFNLDDNPCVDVDIQVIDEDSTSVVIREGEPRIPGGEMTQIDGFRARWHWCPTPEQVNATLRYVLHLEADDGENPPVRQTFDIVLRRGSKPDCPGQAPQISSTAPAQDPYATDRDYQVNATVSDVEGLKDVPLLHYTTEQPDPADPHVERMEVVPFELVEGNQYRAFIPNLRLTEGQERTIYYVVSATDNDDDSGTECDHVTQSAVFQFVVRPGSGTEELPGYCEPCSNDGQCREGLCVVGLADGGAFARESFCGIDCGSGCAQGTCQRVTSRGGLTDMQCAPERLDCSGGSNPEDCVNDGYEDANDDPLTAPAYTIGTVLSGTICPDDHDFYSVMLTAETEYEIFLTGWDATSVDIDVIFRNPEGTTLGVGAGITDSESIVRCSGAAGRYTIDIFGYLDDQGDYLLEVTPTGEPCCTDDPRDNNTQADATSMVCGVGGDGIICPGDEDWWAFSVPAAMRMEVMTVCEGGSGDLDLEIRNAEGTRIGSSASLGCDESVVVNLPEAGTYYARVHGYMDATGTYIIDCMETEGPTCTDSSSCDYGTICDPATGCVDELCIPGDSCPSGHFCPSAGAAGELSACVESCTHSSECRSGYTCKIFESGRGCAPTGAGQSGQACTTFRDCAGERICLDAPPTGYCAEINCTTNADCPTDTHTFSARCVNVGARNICLMDCAWDDSDCDINPGVCTETSDVEGAVAWTCVLPSHSVPPPPPL